MKKNLEYKIIDDFLPQEEFQKIQSYVMNDERNTSDPTSENHLNSQPIGWEYNSNIVSPSRPDESNNFNSSFHNVKHFYMVHMVYMNKINLLMNISPTYYKILPILERLNIKSLIRIKCNLYPNSETVYEHDPHQDLPFSHNSVIFSLNTCDGYTKLNDGTKIGSVANRVLLFDSSIPHQSTTTSDTTARFNINFNYF